ncbi:MAG TPA: hypothetical protein VLM85_11725 [Polyangiaceae bacterium]|nr:hypothetical protein [Polyangiaceae bacterium]
MRVWEGGSRAMASRAPAFGVLAIAIFEACGGRTGLDASPPRECADGAGVIMVAVGTLHACALQAGGALWCWGDNDSGEIGDGTATLRNTPVPIMALTNVGQVSAGGGDDTCAIGPDGALWCWGNNVTGQVGSSGNAFGAELSPVRVTQLASVAQVSIGDMHTCAVQTDNTLWCWGNNPFGQLGIGTTIEEHSPVQVTALTNVAQVSARGEDTCAIKTDGSLWCWGDNSAGELGIGTTTALEESPVQVAALASVAQVGAGGPVTCAIQTGGALWCWGDNTWGAIGDGTTTDAPSPVRVTALTSVAQVSTAGDHVCAVQTDGALFCWGHNMLGQLGDGTTTDAHGPTRVSGLGRVKQVSTGPAFTCALQTDGTVWCWGDDSSGEIADGTQTNQPQLQPVRVTLRCP